MYLLKEIDAEMFRKNQITYEFFSKSPRILNDKSLVVKYNSRYCLLYMFYNKNLFIKFKLNFFLSSS